MMHRATPFDFPLPPYTSLSGVNNFVSSIPCNLCFVLVCLPSLSLSLSAGTVTINLPSFSVFLSGSYYPFLFPPSPKLVEADGCLPVPGSAGGFQLLKGSAFFAFKESCWVVSYNTVRSSPYYVKCPEKICCEVALYK